MALLDRKRGLAAKIEASYGVDPTIAEATDSVLTRNLEVQPMDGDFINRNLDRATLGGEGDIAVAKRVLVTCEVEAAGEGTDVATAPEWADMLLACGFAETVVALTEVQYDPVSSAFDSLWLEVNTDGNQHVCKGARGNMQLDLSARAIPFFTFSYTGLYQVPTSVALPTYTTTGFTVPEAVNNENTITATLHGQPIVMESLTIDMQNQIEHIDRVGTETIELVNRSVRGQISFEAPLISGFDWFTRVANRTQGALAIQHGDTANNIFEVDAPNVELSNPQLVESQGTLMLNMDLLLIPGTGGDDEIQITTR